MSYDDHPLDRPTHNVGLLVILVVAATLSQLAKRDTNDDH